MHVVRSLLWIGASCGLLLSCGEPSDGNELALRRVTPALLEPGSTLRIEGHGFPPGDACELRFEGVGHRPGLSSERVDARVACRALSDDEVAAQMDGALLRRLGGRGTFEGALRLGFAAPGGPALHGAMRLTIDLGLPPDMGGVAEQALRERARRVLDFAGVVLADEEPTGAGLVVAALRDAGQAAELGLRARDVIVAASGVNIHSLQDLAPRANAQRVALRVQRAGQSEPLEVELSLLGALAPDSSPALLRSSVLLAWLLACVLLLSPLPRAALRLAREDLRRRRSARAQSSWWRSARASPRVAGVGARSLPAFPELVPAVLLSVAATTALAYAPTRWHALRPLQFWLGFAALEVTLSSMRARGDTRERLRAVLDSAFFVLVLGVPIACASLLFGVQSFDSVVAGQGAWPLAWTWLQRPTMLAALPLYLIAACRIQAHSTAQPNAGNGGLTRAQRMTESILLCGLGVVLFAGGWQIPVALARLPQARVLGPGLFVLKAWGFAWLLAWIRPLVDALRFSSLALVCVVTPAFMAAWFWLEPAPVVELSITRALAASLALVALVTWARAAANPPKAAP